MTISEFIELIGECDSLSIDVKYVHPTLYILCLSETFNLLSDDARLQHFCDLSKIPLTEILSIKSNPIVELALITEQEKLQDYGYMESMAAGKHWLGAFNPLNTAHNDTDVLLVTDGTENPNGINQLPYQAKAIHFYGYKGGQGRSTVLLSLAKTLADAGYRVLLVDADIEAPSLDSMLGIAASDINSTLMGLCELDREISPLSRAYVGTTVSGYIDLIAARPPLAKFDMDFAAFLLNASLDAKVLELAVSRLRQFVSSSDALPQQRYDIVLFDHRTGLAPSVLPIMEAWPGPAVIFVRPDGMARHIQDSRLLDALLAHDADSPGAFVSFSLDPKKTVEVAKEKHARFIEKLLEKIADAMQSDEDIDPSELERYWVFWRHDQSLVDGGQPSPSEMSIGNRDAISQLRSVLGLSGNPAVSIEKRKDARLTSSGSSDEGQFILTPDIAKLFSSDSPYTYVFGRKGTGKTRLLTELVRQELGEPMLVANDSEVGGLKSAGPLFEQLLNACNRDFETFWWRLLEATISIPNTRDDLLSSSLSKSIDNKNSSERSTVINNILKIVSPREKRRIFLIDGVETAVPASDLRAFVEALFRFLAAVQFDKVLSRAITIRLFLRTDLSTGAAQNVEQQIEGSAIYLHWNKTAILNFALARIASLPWFVNQFSEVCDRINGKSDEISRGALSDDISESLLLEIFPRGLERNKLKTTTFFASYFSDAGGDAGGDAAFYPRLFDGFLRTLAINCEKAVNLQLPDGRLPSINVLQAYDQASRSFIEEVRTELYAFLNIEQESAKNKQAVDSFITAFRGLKTPFQVEEIIQTLASLSSIPIDQVRQSLASMQKIGMFEARPGYPGELRAGRLYKAGLEMKYVRANRKPA